MTKDQIEAIAEIMRNHKEIADNNVVDASWIVSNIVYRLSRYFEKEEDTFEPFKFLKACGYGGDNE